MDRNFLFDLARNLEAVCGSGAAAVPTASQWAEALRRTADDAEKRRAATPVRRVADALIAEHRAEYA